MAGYLKPKTHDRSEVGTRVRDGKAFDHTRESSNSSELQTIETVKVYFTNHIVAGIEVRYCLNRNFAIAARESTSLGIYHQLGTAVDIENYQEIVQRQIWFIALRVYTNDDKIVGIEFVSPGADVQLAGTNDAQRKFEFSGPIVALHGETSEYLNVIGAVGIRNQAILDEQGHYTGTRFVNHKMRPAVAERKPPPPRIIETSIMGAIRTGSTKFTDLRQAKKYHHIIEATIETNQVGIIGTIIVYIDSDGRKKEVVHRAPDISSESEIVKQKTLNIEQDPTERFTKVRGYHNGVLTFLELETNKNRKLKNGLKVGDEFDFFVAPNKHLAGFVGATADVFQSLGLILYNDLEENVSDN